MMRPRVRSNGMKIVVSLAILALLLLSGALFVLAAPSNAPAQSASGNVRIDASPASRVNGVAGQFVTVRANITNLSADQTISGIAYISIVDINNSLPIDLEDWSAQKGIYVPSIAPGQSVSTEWSIRLVKAGSYTIDVLFNKDGDLSSPVASSRIAMDVAPKVNLNPGNVLPVAFGVPILLVVVFALINYRRGKKMGVYG